MIATLIIIVVAYLAGAIPFGLIIARLYGVKDLRSVGSGNIGATNVQRVAGMKAAIWVYMLDMGKGIAVILVARQFNQQVMSQEIFLVLVAVAVILGHIFPVYIRFKGGKGINTAFGALLLLFPLEALIALATFFIIAFLTGYISLGSISSALALPITMLIERFIFAREVSDNYLVLTIILAVVILYAHRANIKRLLAGQENSFRSQSKSDGASSHA